MTVFDTIDPDTTDGTELAAELDARSAKLLSQHKGTSRPSYAVAGTIWVDSSAAPVLTMYYYDGSDDIALFSIDTTTDTALPANGAQQLPSVDTFTGDGAETDFTLTNTPAGAAALVVAVGGVVQTRTTDFTLSGKTLSFTFTPPDTVPITVIDFSDTAILDSGKVATVAGIAADVSAVAAIAAAVSAVNADAADIQAVADDLTGDDDIGAVAAAIADVQTVAPSIADVSALAAQIDAVGTAVMAPALAIFAARHAGVQPPSLALNLKEVPGLEKLLSCVRSGAAYTVDQRRRIVSVAANEPRIWHDPATGERLYGLNEEALTYEQLQSEALDTSPWADVGTPVVAEVTSGPRSPRGGNYFTIEDDDGAVGEARRQEIDISAKTPGDPLMVAMLCRQETAGLYPAIRVRALDDAANVDFDCRLHPFQDGGQQKAELTGAWDDFGFVDWPDGWRLAYGRLLVPTPTSGTLDVLRVDLHPAWNANAANNTTDTAQTGKNGFFGLQVYDGWGLASYMPTTTSQITRQADLISKALAGHVADKALTVMVAYRVLRPNIANDTFQTPAFLGAGGGDADDYIQFRQRSSGAASPGLISAVIDVGGALTVLQNGSATAKSDNQTVRQAVAIDGDGAAWEQDGEGIGDTDTPGFPDQSVMTDLVIGATPAGTITTHHNIGIEQVYLWPVALDAADRTEVTG